MNSFRDQKATVSNACDGLRLDQAISRTFGISRRKARVIIQLGGAYLNKKRCRLAGKLVHRGQHLRIAYLNDEQTKSLHKEQIVWQQGDLVLIHKRCGQYSQEALHRSIGCLPDELRCLLGRPFRPIHRLDRDTSGLILFSASRSLHLQLQTHWKTCARKTYLAVVEPAPAWETLTIDLPISRQRATDGRYAVDVQRGRPSLTHARVIERRDQRALLELRPLTGRTHQLRIHLSAVGCPILGDTRYGGKPHERMMLHAWKLSITPPALPVPQAWEAHPEEDWKW
ncbi:MAG: RluA family pseudouridine synthase [Zetaproteobacteria bacterium]|nr:MAG: RluA family pseudouridine synthase [Zetaproteobacteria bacterium]